MGHLSGQRLRDLKISQLLANILQITCLQCYNLFDKETHRPYMIGPCQHHYCAKCLDEVIFSRWEETACPQCTKKVTKAGIRRNPYLEQVLDIQKQFSSTGAKSKISQLEQDIARKFLTTFEPFCRYCQQMFDLSAQRRPVIVCQAQHLVCSQCLNGRFKDDGYCHVCSERMFDKDNLYHFKLFELMVEFIKTTLFTRKLTFEAGERQFHLSVDGQVTIKDVFHFLQEHELISRQLEITQCSFHQRVQLENQREKEIEVKFTASANDISKDESIIIVMKFAPGALKKGARVTMPSKIVKKLAIKINNFEPAERFSYQQRDQFEDLGKVHQIKREEPAQKKEKSRSHIKQDNNEEVEKQLYPDLNYEPKYIKYKPIELNHEQEIHNNNWPLNNEVSASKLKLIEHSRLKEKEKEEERRRISIVKSSKIPKRKQLEVGTEIPEINLQNYATKVAQGNQRDKIFADFLDSHIINEKDESLICFRTEKVINTKFTQEEYQADAIIENDIYEKAQKSENTLALLLTILKRQIQDGDIRVLYSPKSTQRSRTSLKIITSHFISDRIIIKETFNEDEQWYFEKLYESQEQLSLFLDKQKRRAVTKFGISEQSIVFHKLVKPMVLYMSTNQGEEVARNIKRNLDRNIEIEPYFKQLELSPEDFDKAGLISFPKSKKNVEFRGNLPYYQPINCIRYGIKVKGQFDKGQDIWLSMNNKLGEWAVGFHGVRNPNNNYKNYKNVIESIIGSRSNGRIVIQSQKVSYQSDKCANKKEEMGAGILLTPSFEMALSQSESIQIGDKSYHLVFQCRLKPDQIKISSRNNCKWVVNRSSAIRPYGIVIIQNGARLTYPTLQQQFGKPFLYQNYKDKIEALKS